MAANGMESTTVVDPSKLRGTDGSLSTYKQLFNDVETEQNRMKQSLLKCFTKKVNRLTSMNILTEHIDTLLTLRDKYTEKYVMDIRGDISAMWDICMFGEAQRSEFEAFSCETFNEQTLIAHEEELKNLQECYDLHKDLYKLASKRERLWKEKINFENPADGSAKFENRGGALIKELKKYQVRDLPQSTTNL